MSLKYEAVELEARTEAGTARYSASFADGLNVLAAPNTWGKSTLAQSLIYGLGLEGMLSASRQSPLGEAMTRVVETPNGRQAVYESSVTLTISNRRGQFLRARRHPRSTDFGENLIQTWTADTLDGLGAATQVDTFVREPGAAVNESGFHYVLQRFLGWNLPLVPSYGDRDIPLYMELLFPLFYVEQKFGWAGISPRVPTYLRVREPLRRGVEFLLGLSTLERIKRRAELRDAQASIVTSWTSLVSRLREQAAREGWQIIGLSDRPVGSSGIGNASVLVPDGDGVAPLEAMIERWRASLASRSSDVPPSAYERTDQSSQELEALEQRYRVLGAQLRASQENLNLGLADLEALDRKLAELDEDRRRLRDAGRLERLGSALQLTLVSAAMCPTCDQELNGRMVPTNAVRSLAETATLASQEEETLRTLRVSIQLRVDESRARTTSIDAQLREIRRQIRLLRDELAGPSAAASVVEVRQRLDTEDRISSAERILNTLVAVNAELVSLADELDNVRAQLAELAGADDDASDLRALTQFSERFVDQLREYGLRSLPPDSVTIDPASLIPVNDGAELVFNVATGMSASDTVRTKWAYYVALAETCYFNERSNHPGFLMFDEPRQQEADRESIRAFVSRLDRLPPDMQVLFLTSEPPDELARTLEGTSYTLLPADGARLLS